MLSYLMCRSESLYTFVFSRVSQNKPLEWIATEDYELKPASPKTMEIITPIGLYVGKGNFGDVCMVMNQSSQKYCTVKFVSKQSVFERNLIDNLQREIDICPKLNHTFILGFLAAYETPACIGLAFELAYGGVLTDRIEFRGCLPELEAKFYFCEILSGLTFLHETVGIIHRDLRTTNILLDSMGHVKLAEFGSSVLITDTVRLNDHHHQYHSSEGSNNNNNNNNITTTNSTNNSSQHSNNRNDKNNHNNNSVVDDDDILTASADAHWNAYMAPEMLIKSATILQGCEKKVDYFSLGCILLEMITGNPPSSTSLTRYASSLPLFMRKSLKQLVRGLLIKNPVQRWGSKEVMMSGWTDDINWEKLEDRRCFPPWIPVASKQPTLKYFKPVSDCIDTMQSVDPKADYYFKKLHLPSNLKTPGVVGMLSKRGNNSSGGNNSGSNSFMRSSEKSMSQLVKMSTKEMNQQLLSRNNSNMSNSSIRNNNSSSNLVYTTGGSGNAVLKIKQRIKSGGNLPNNNNNNVCLSDIRDTKSSNRNSHHHDDNSSANSSVHSNHSSSIIRPLSDSRGVFERGINGNTNSSSTRYSAGWKSSSTVVPVADDDIINNNNDINNETASVTSTTSMHRRQSSTAKLLAPSRRSSSRLSRNNSSVGGSSKSNNNSSSSRGNSSRNSSFHHLNTITDDATTGNYDDGENNKNRRRSSSGSNDSRGSSNASSKNSHNDNDDGGYGISPHLLMAASNMNMFDSNNSINGDNNNKNNSTINADTTNNNRSNSKSNMLTMNTAATVAAAAASMAIGRKKSVKFGENVDLFAQGPAAAAVNGSGGSGGVSRGNSISNVYNKR